MSRLRDLRVLIGVACAVSGSSFVLGQGRDVALLASGRGTAPARGERRK